MSTEDLAYSPELWTYDTGLPDRKPKLVIRLREDSARQDAKVAKTTLDIEDDSGAGDS